MFSTNHLSPQQLSAFTALILSVPIGLGSWWLLPGWKMALVIFILIFIGSYLLVRTVLDSFIYRKIKLIYKVIYQTKATKKEETYYKYILPQKGIDEVREDVEQWARQRKAEIETLKTNENYRKEFLQNLAHEFKTPIFAIQGYVDTLLQGAMDNPETRKRFLENTSRNVERMVHLLEDLDEISRLESGEQPLYPTQFVIQDLIKDAFEALSIKTTAKKHSLQHQKGLRITCYSLCRQGKNFTGNRKPAG